MDPKHGSSAEPGPGHNSGSNGDDDDGFLTGNLLIAMPAMSDPRFVKTVIFLCAHSEQGAMGLVINKPMPSISFPDLLDQLGIESAVDVEDLKVHFGGPVESGRGFVLHSTDFVRDGTLVVSDEVALTATLDVLRSIARGKGPRHHALMLGYAGWEPGQLDREIRQNGWLIAPADDAILFDRDLSTKWERAIARLGISPAMLSTEAGEA